MKPIYLFQTIAFAAAAVFAQDSLSSAEPTSQSSAADASSTSSVASSSASASASASGSASASSTGPSVAVAAATGSPTQGFSLPSGISDKCTAFLEGLDEDTHFGSCVAPLLTATQAFSPSNSTSKDKGALTKALDTFCSATGCTDTYVRTELTQFYAACKAELTGATPNKAVLDTYDILYLMKPLQGAICTKDGGEYCVLKAPSDSAAADAGNASSNPLGVSNNVVVGGTDIQIVDAAAADVISNGFVPYSFASLRRRAPAPQTQQQIVQYAPNTQVYRDNGVMYLFTLPSLGAKSLCTNCTKSVISTYVAWETAVAYGPGLKNSPMLGGQADLWKALNDKCGKTFIAAVNAQAGTTKKNPANGAESLARPSSLLGLAAVALTMVFAL